jgi:hypothetical protein
MNDEDSKKEGSTVSTKKTWKNISTVPTDDIDLKKLKGLTFEDKVYYLTVRGWMIDIESRGDNKYIYAKIYKERKKKRFYLGKSEDRPEILKLRSDNHNIVVDYRELIGLNFKDKIYYLAIRGWRVEIEIHNNEEYIYAIKYIDNKKDRFRLGKKEDSPDLENFTY